jgi:hypothetical protein
MAQIQRDARESVKSRFSDEEFTRKINDSLFQPLLQH